jgi:alpha-pyrone synthase
VVDPATAGVTVILSTAIACINAIGTAVPDHDIHHAFIGWAETRLTDPRERALFRRMAARAGIEHRWSVLPRASGGGSPVGEGGFYADAMLPSTASRMEVYARTAPGLALMALARLREQCSFDGVTHLVVASCTGFVAPGIDQIIARELGLGGQVERTLIGFMGCYAAVAALRTAYHIVRSEHQARVLVVTVELSTLHLQPENRLEPLLAMLQFGDGAAAALVSAEPRGLQILRPFAATLEDSDDLIRWTIGDQGFAMHLSGEVPGRILRALGNEAFRTQIGGDPAGSWAVHAGGRSILDAVEDGLGLSPDALSPSREVLQRFGNMSSATLMFVLQSIMAAPGAETGTALAFGPGLAAEGFTYRRLS